MADYELYQCLRDCPKYALVEGEFYLLAHRHDSDDYYVYDGVSNIPSETLHSIFGEANLAEELNGLYEEIRRLNNEIAELKERCERCSK